MKIIEFKNGNFNLKYSKEEQFNFDFNEYNLMKEFYYILENLLDFDNTYTIGNFECAGNDEMLIRLYNERMNKVYIMLVQRDIMKLVTGETLKLIAHEPDDYENQLIKEENEVI